jgi:hypothetical protein
MPPLWASLAYHKLERRKGQVSTAKAMPKQGMQGNGLGQAQET